MICTAAILGIGTGVVSSVLVEITKSFINELLPNQEISKEISKAFDKALNKWENNNTILKNQKASRIISYREKLEKIIVQKDSINNLDSETQDILNFLYEEIIINPITNNYFENLQLQEHTRLLKTILDSLEAKNISIGDIYDKINKHNKQIENLLRKLGTGVDEIIKEEMVNCSNLLNKIIEEVPNKEYHDNKFNDISKQLEDIKLLIQEYSENLLNSNGKQTVSNSKSRKKECIVDLPYDFFIKKLEKTNDYIPRKVIETSEEYDDENNPKRKSLIDVIRHDKSKTVLLASAGFGKSTELKEVIIKIASEGKYYPIFKAFNTYDVSKAIEDILPLGWREIPEDKLVVFFDGFDEIESRDIIKIKKQIIKFCSNYSDVRIVISSRTNFYNIPIKDQNNGTLKDFKSFYLTELTLKDIKYYLELNFSGDTNDFMFKIKEIGLYDLLINPFFLKLFINYYKNNKEFPKDRRAILEYCIDSRFFLDQEHFDVTYDIDEKKHIAFKLLRKIALAMEIVGVQKLSDNELREIIPDIDDLKLVKYCTIFKKQENIDLHWMFEHKYFQEYLCAILLSNLSIQNIKHFVCYPNSEKLSPQWLNTISLLISILDTRGPLLVELVEWLYLKQSVFVDNIEKDKLSDEILFKKLQLVFNKSKKNNTWIDSKFIEKLVEFNKNNNEIIDFLIKEVLTNENHNVVKLNAVRIISLLDIQLYFDRNKIKNAFLGLINNNLSDSNLLFSVIIAFDKCKFHDKETVAYVFDLLKCNNTQYVRAGMYKYLANSENFEEYVDYYIEGYKLINNKNEEREENNLLDESYNLGEVLKKIKSSKGLKKILNIEFIRNILDNNFESKDLLDGIVSNAIETYKKDCQILNFMQKILMHTSIHWYSNNIENILVFFHKTNTRDVVFNNMLNVVFLEDNYYNEIKTIPYLTDSSNVGSIVNKLIEVRNIASTHLEKEEIESKIKFLYQNIKSKSQKLSEIFKMIVEKETDIRIIFPKQIDWDLIRNEKVQKSFNMLFDKNSLKTECERIFGDKEELTLNELRNMSDIDNSDVELKDTFVEGALFIVKQFAKEGRIARKNEVINWFNLDKKFEIYFKNQIYKYLKNNKKLSISNTQKVILKEWFNKNIEDIDLTKAISSKESGDFSIDSKLILLMFLAGRFDFECSEDKYLDMLAVTIENIGDGEIIKFDDIVQKVVNKEKLNNRIVENIIEQKISMFSIYQNHVKYVLNNKLEIAIPAIIECITSNCFNVDYQETILDLLLEKEYFESVENAFDNLEVEVALYVIDKFIKIGNIEFCTNKLLKLYINEFNEENKRMMCLYLIKCQEIKGLEYLLEWVKNNKHSPFKYNDSGMFLFSGKYAFGYLFNLLKLSFTIKVSNGIFYSNFRSVIMSWIENYEFSVETDFTEAINTLKTFLEENLDKYENVGYLSNTIDNLSENYYKNNIKKHSFEEAKKKIAKFIKD